MFNLHRIAFLLFCLGSLCIHAQEQNNPGRKITIMHLTDVHGWIAGHPHNPFLNADFGDFASFVEHTTNLAHSEGREFFLFDSGDIIEGTGISDATRVHGVHIFPVIMKIPHYTGLTIGNHDIGHTGSVELMKHTFIPFYNSPEQPVNGRYLTANSHYAISKDFLGPPYYVKTTDSGLRVLIMGFIFNFTLPAYVTNVTPVQEALEQSWFAEAMKLEKIDMIVTTMHIDPQSYPEMQQVYQAIRANHPTVPLIMLTGHRHLLYFDQLDANAVTLESGKYFEHIGIIDFTLQNGVMKDFEYKWIDTNMDVFYNLSKTNSHTFLTPLGREIKGMILDSQLQLNLSYPLGCSPHLYTVGAPMNLENHSLYYLYIQQIIPTQVFNYSLPNTQFFISNTASLRYDLFKGLVNNNDIYTISPFNDVFYCFFNISGVELQQLTNYVTVNSSLAAEHAKKFGRVAYEHGRAPGSPVQMPSIPHTPSSPYFYSETKINPNAYYDVVASQYDAASLTPVLEMLFPQNGPIKALPYPTERTSTDALAEFVVTQWPCRPDCPCSS